MLNEQVKRLVPDKETLRELYLKSGNQCAFPGCKAVMIDADGDFVGQMTHIEAAERGGPRFNEKMSNDDRRASSNLMLLCYPHHVKTHDESKYTAEALKEMKEAHEAKFTDVAQKIEDTITDQGKKSKAGKVLTLNRWKDIMGWPSGTEELEYALKGITWTISRLQELPLRTRQLLSIIISRLEKKNFLKGNYDYSRKVTMKEVCEATNLPAREIHDHVRIMEKYEIAKIQEGDDEHGPVMNIHVLEYPTEGFYLGEFKEFCARSGTPLEALIEDLQFEILD